MSGKKRILGTLLAALVVTSMFAGAGVVSAASTVDGELKENGTYWAGEELSVNTSETNSEVELMTEDDDFVRQYQTDSNGDFVLDTSGLDGQYYLDVAGSQTKNFSVYSQDLTVNAESDSVTNGATDASNATVDIDSNRAEYDLNVSADSLEASELANITAGVGDSQTVQDETVVLHNVSDGEYTLTFENVEKGDYNMSFNAESTDASADVSMSVAQDDDGDAQFSDSAYAQQRGDVVEFTVDLDDRESAQVVFGNLSESGYEANFTVEDNNDDGEVTVRFNSYEAGSQNGETFTALADSEDAVTGVSESSLDDKLVTGTYHMDLLVNNDRSDVAAVSLTERSTNDIATFVAPSDAETTNASEVAEAVNADSTVAFGDKAVVAIDASGLAGYTEDISASDLAEDSSFAQDNGVYVTVEGEERMNQDPKQISLDSATLVQDADDDTYFLVFDTSSISNAEDGDEYTATFHMNESSEYVDEGEEQNVSADFSVVERTASFDNVNENETVVLNSQGDNFSVAGDSTVAAGSEITVMVEQAGDSPFIKSEEVEVADDGSFEVEFNASSVEEGDELSVQVDSLTEQRDAVVAAQEDVSETPADSETYNVSVDAVDASGESVDAQVAIAGDAGATTELENGTYTVEATADGYEAASQEFNVSGEDVSLTLTLEQKETTDQPESTATEQPTDEPSTSTDGQPGFGFAVAGGAIALAGAALAVLRR